jgi:hypothetical protein
VVSPQVIEETGQHLSYYFDAIRQGLEEDCFKALDPSLIGEILYQDIVAVVEHVRRAGQGNEQTVIAQGFEVFWDGVRKQDLNHG